MAGRRGQLPRSLLGDWRVAVPPLEEEPPHVFKVCFGKSASKFLGQSRRQFLQDLGPVFCLFLALLLMFDDAAPDLEVCENLQRVDGRGGRFTGMKNQIRMALT